MTTRTHSKAGIGGHEASVSFVKVEESSFVSSLKKSMSFDKARAAQIAAITPEFDAAYYLRINGDVAAAGSHPLLHYVDYGWKEGRNPSRLFWTKYYLDKNKDVALEECNPFYHYITRGRAEGRKPNPIGPSFWPALVAPPRRVGTICVPPKTWRTPSWTSSSRSMTDMTKPRVDPGCSLRGAAEPLRTGRCQRLQSEPAHHPGAA